MNEHHVDFQNEDKVELEPYLMAKNEILVVDDETDFRLDLAELLFTQGFRVVTAKNGREALDYIIHSRRLPELITLDVKMPEKDGIYFLKELRKISKDLPIVFISGFVRNQEIDPYTFCLEKPLDRLKLLDVIEQTRKRNIQNE